MATSLSVPKSHTPSQWKPRISLEQVCERVQYPRDTFRVEKCLRLRWHEPEMSFLEGVLSRADHRIIDVVEKAYRRGAIPASWMDHFSIDP